MPARRYDVIRIQFTDGQTVYDWPILKISLCVTVRILTASGYTIESENDEPQRNNAVSERIHLHAGADAEKVKR